LSIIFTKCKYVHLFKLKNIYDFIQQAKNEMRTEMKARVEKERDWANWANWAIGELRSSVNALKNENRRENYKLQIFTQMSYL
jgi:hypothetical protein